MTQTIFAYIVGGILLLIALFFLARPLKMLFKIAISSALGCVGLIVFNFFCGLVGLYIGVNIATATTLGILGLPGLAMILILQLVFK